MNTFDRRFRLPMVDNSSARLTCRVDRSPLTAAAHLDLKALRKKAPASNPLISKSTNTKECLQIILPLVSTKQKHVTALPKPTYSVRKDTQVPCVKDTPFMSH